MKESAAVIDKTHNLIQLQAVAGMKDWGAMKNKYVVSLWLLAIGLGVAYVVTAAALAGAAKN